MEDRVRQQFGPAAKAYSRTHLFAQGKDLRWLVERVAPRPHETVLDIGTAAGHTAFALAPFVERVVGLDITPAMVDVARKNARARRLGNFEAVVAAAESLPFPDCSFDVVTCRYTAHHFDSPTPVLHEVARVLRPGGRLAIVDNTAPNNRALDKWINEFEILRDPSHVRELTVAEWRGLLTTVGFSFEVVKTWMLALDFEDWTARQQTPPERVTRLRYMLDHADTDTRKAFQITASSFALLTRLMYGVLRADRKRSHKR